jgi:hypothetical protein
VAVNVCCKSVCDNVADVGDTDPAPDGDTLVVIVIPDGGGVVVCFNTAINECVPEVIPIFFN